VLARSIWLSPYQVRSRSGLTHEELAERAGVSVRAISDLERAVHRYVYVSKPAGPEISLVSRRRGADCDSGQPPNSGQSIEIDQPGTEYITGRLRDVTQSLQRANTRLLLDYGRAPGLRCRLAKAQAGRADGRADAPGWQNIRSVGRKISTRAHWRPDPNARFPLGALVRSNLSGADYGSCFDAADTACQHARSPEKTDLARATNLSASVRDKRSQVRETVLRRE
jgi:helix-turn-helix protein